MSRSLRIVVAGPVFPDSFTENVVVACQALGHEAFAQKASKSSSLHGITSRAKVVLDKLGVRSAHRDEELWLLETTRSLKPDLIICPTVPISDEALTDLHRASKVKIVAWWGDAPANLQRLDLMSQGWDAIFLKDPDAVAKFHQLGLPSFLLNEAMNPSWHRPLANGGTDAVLIAGNWYGFRQQLVRRLDGVGVPLHLYGPKPPRWSLPEVVRHHRGEYISKERKATLFGAAAACLNNVSFAEGNSLNCRAFEIAGSGGLQLMEYRSHIETCFEPGREILTYRTFEELTDLIERARKSPASFASIRAAGAKRALADHTYAHRVQTIISTVLA